MSWNSENKELTGVQTSHLQQEELAESYAHLPSRRLSQKSYSQSSSAGYEEDATDNASFRGEFGEVEIEREGEEAQKVSFTFICTCAFYSTAWDAAINK